MTDSDKSQARARLRQLATESIENRDPTGWFEKLYRGANAVLSTSGRRLVLAGASIEAGMRTRAMRLRPACLAP